jgi:hypothetical protein
LPVELGAELGVGVAPGLEGRALPDVVGDAPAELGLLELLAGLLVGLLPDGVQPASTPAPDTTNPEPRSSKPRLLSCGLSGGGPLLGDSVDVEDALD